MELKSDKEKYCSKTYSRNEHFVEVCFSAQNTAEAKLIAENNIDVGSVNHWQRKTFKLL